jgi:hypothetical protein
MSVLPLSDARELPQLRNWKFQIIKGRETAIGNDSVAQGFFFLFWLAGCPRKKGCIMYEIPTTQVALGTASIPFY